MKDKPAFKKAMRVARAIKNKGQDRRRIDAWFRFMKLALKG